MDPDLAVRLADFSAGTPTLPAVFALRHDGELRSLLRPGLSHGEQARALHLLRHSGGIAASVQVAYRLAHRACASLSGLADRGDTAAIAYLSRLPERYLSDALSKRVDPSLEFLLPRPVTASTRAS